MKITRLYILIILFIVTGVWAGILLYSEGSVERAHEANKIAIDTGKVVSISFGTPGKMNVLKKEGRGWMINSKYAVNPRLSKVTLVAFTKMEIKHPVAAENKASVMKLLKNGVKMEVKTTEGTNVFWLAANSNDMTSTYYLAEGSTEPQIVHVPNVTGNLITLFLLGEQDWRIRNLFPGNIPDIELIELTYNEEKEKNQSFFIKGNNGAFTITGIANLDSMRFYSYIAFYQQVTVDNYVTGVGIDELKGLEGTKPYAVIKVKDLDPTRNRTIRFYQGRQFKGHLQVPVYIEETREWAWLGERAVQNLLIYKDYFAVGKNQP